jgi:vitamin B12 transporter
MPLPLLLLAAATDEIVVTGRSLADAPGMAAYGAVTIPRARLAGDASGRLETVLRDVAGFQQFRRTDSRAANPTSQGATLRALGGNAASRALVLRDGVPQADPFAGYIAWSALDPARLGSVRITRGGGAGPFGAGAVAGTIELMSAGPDDLPAISARALAGSRNAWDASAGIARPLGGGFVTLGGQWTRGDGYVLIPRGQRGAADLPARYRSWSLSARAVAPVGDDAELQASGLAFDDRRLRGQAGTASRSSGTDASVRLIGRGRWGYEIIAYIQARDFSSGFVATAADRSTATPTLDQYATPATGIGGKIELRPPVGGGHVLRLGVDARHAAGRTNERFRYQAGLPTRLRRAGGRSLTAGLFIEDDWTIGPVTLTAGARIDRWEISGGNLVEREIGSGAMTQAADFADRSGTRPTARAGLLYAPGGAVDLRAAAYAGFRIPTLNELYRPFRVGADATAANAALAPERLRGIEGGVTLRPADRVRIDATLFWNRLDKAIANVTLGQGPGVYPQVGFVAAGGVFRQRLNVDAIRVRGIEAEASAVLASSWRLSASFAWADARVRASGLAAELDGRRPAQSPAWQMSTTLAWAPRAGADASLTLRYVGGQAEDDLGQRRLPPALTVDATAAVPLGRGVRLIARAENMFDARVVSGISSTGVEDLGTPRSLWIGAQIGF